MIYDFEQYKPRPALKRPVRPFRPKADASPEAFRSYADELERHGKEMKSWSSSVAEHRDEARKLANKFRVDALTEVGLIVDGVEHPKAERVWDMAYDNGHAEGYSCVYQWLEELSTLVLD